VHILNKECPRQLQTTEITARICRKQENGTNCKLLKFCYTPRYSTQTRKTTLKNHQTKVSNPNSKIYKCSEHTILQAEIDCRGKNNSEPIFLSQFFFKTKYSEPLFIGHKSTKPLKGKGNKGKATIFLSQFIFKTKYSEPLFIGHKSTKPLKGKGNKGKATNITESNKYSESNKQQSCLSDNIRTNNKNLHNFIQIKILRSNDIETNPGPYNNIGLETTNPSNLIILSYNLQGCKDHKKLKRVINFFLRQPFKNNCIINLQETHLSNNNTLKYHWRQGVFQSTTQNNSGGVAILYNNGFFDEILDNTNDNEGRMCSFTAIKNDVITTFINVYAPNDHIKSKTFFNSLEQLILNTKEKFPSTGIVISGDFNFVFDKDTDSIGRQFRQQESELSDNVKRIMTRQNLTDSYRSIHKWGGFTWGRDNPSFIRSRLDHILISNNLTNELIQCYTNKSPNESDHSLIYIEMNNREVKFGPGIKRCNSNLLENEDNLNNLLECLNTHLNNIDRTWNPHQKLDYMKMILRDKMLELGRIEAKIEKTELEYNNMEIDNLNKKMEHLLIEANKNDTNLTKYLEDIDKIKLAIEMIEELNKPIKDKRSQNLIFRSRAKWAEKGEKSNKYFLNLLKQRQQKLQIRKIIANGQTHYTQDEISKAITNFYRNLYSKNKTPKDINETKDEMFKDLPKISNQDKERLSKPITEAELTEALKTCTESSPGPDGITYGTYKKTWMIFGKLIFESWNYSNKIGQLSTSQKDSTITLLEKKGKEKVKIENLRPISLSNCDIKICTKAIALRTNPILKSIMHHTQTGYIPGTQITDNCRLIEEIIDYMNSNNEQGYLITLDAQKAFDSVDHAYLLKILHTYGFPPTYISWVKILYNNLRTCVQVNGYSGEIFKVERSVKQGDALSCSLFIIAIDPLLCMEGMTRC
jgi:exonuclease III